METGAALGELLLATLNEQRLGRTGRSVEDRTPGRLFMIAGWSMRIGLGLRLARRPPASRAHDVASLCFLAGGLAFRYAWSTPGACRPRIMRRSRRWRAGA